MSTVFECACGRRTTEPFVIRGMKYCTICAEDINPDIVSSRERFNYSRYERRTPRYRPDKQELDFGKHR